MKRIRILIPISIIIIFTIIIIVIVFDGHKKGENYATTYLIEEIESIKAVNFDNMPDESYQFDTNFVVYDFSDGGITFEVNILNPKKEMKQVVVSAFLGDEILNYINTPHSLITNIIAVKNADNSFKDNFNLIPHGNVTGISASSNMIYFANTKLSDVLKILPHVIIKVSWIDEQNKAKEEYIKYSKDNYIIINFTKEFMDMNKLVSSFTLFPHDVLFAGVKKDNSNHSFIIHFTSTKAQERQKVFNFTDKGEIKFVKLFNNRIAKFNYGESQEGYIDVMTNEIIW